MKKNNKKKLKKLKIYGGPTRPNKVRSSYKARSNNIGFS